MCNNKEIDNGSNKKTTGNGSIPRFLGNEGKGKEVSSVFAAILEGGLHQGNESQGTVQSYWLDPVEKLAKDNGVWIGKLSSMASVEIGYGHENTVFLSKDGNSVIKFNNLRDIHDKTSLISPTSTTMFVTSTASSFLFPRSSKARYPSSISGHHGVAPAVATALP